MHTSHSKRKPPVIRVVHSSDAARLSLLLSQAFYDDPVYQWFFPEGLKRTQKCRRLFNVFLNDLLPQRTVFTTSALEGAALWIPPQNIRQNWSRQIKYNLQILSILGASILRGLKWQLFVESKHPDYPHWYLFLLGIAPEHQGQGIGSQLLQPMLKRCDAENLPIYLDTGNSKNVPFYQHRGFEIVNQIELTQSLTVYQMIRTPDKG